MMIKKRPQNYIYSTTRLAGVLLTFFVFANPSTASEVLPGVYEIVTVRNASDVAATASPMSESDSPIGENISFSANQLSMSGLACDSWEISEKTDSIVNLSDPNLADINVAPTDSPISIGDQRIMEAYNYSCEGESFLNILQVDERVIVIPWANSSKYLIAETPLTTEQISQLQKQLKSMKFYEGEISGVLDTSTLSAVSAWAEYRGNNTDGYRFSRAAITENLLDALQVLDKPKHDQQ